MYKFTDITHSTVGKYSEQTTRSQLSISCPNVDKVSGVCSPSVTPANESTSQVPLHEVNLHSLNPLSPIDNEFTSNDESEDRVQASETTGKLPSNDAHRSVCHNALEPNHKQSCIHIQKRKEIERNGNRIWMRCPVYNKLMKESRQNQRDLNLSNLLEFAPDNIQACILTDFI